MNAARTYADELLARFTEPAPMRLSGTTPAKTANPAKDKHSCGPAGHSALCEGLRIAANPGQAVPTREPDSQAFAGIRSPASEPQSEQRRGFSQDSRFSQGYPAANASASRRYRLSTADADRCHWPPWTDAEIATFVARVALFLRRGVSATDADDLAERLVLRDRDGDDRVMCAECAHLRLGRCGNHRRAGLQSAELGCDLAGTLQRCPGFKGP